MHLIEKDMLKENCLYKAVKYNTRHEVDAQEYTQSICS